MAIANEPRLVAIEDCQPHPIEPAITRLLKVFVAVVEQQPAPGREHWRRACSNALPLPGSGYRLHHRHRLRPGLEMGRGRVLNRRVLAYERGIPAIDPRRKEDRVLGVGFTEDCAG